MISEKGLCRQMKQAHKYGYHVVGQNGTLVIDAETWAVVVTLEQLPRKALGLLVEHVGYIPGNEAVRVAKDAPNQEEMPDVVLERTADFKDAVIGQTCQPAKGIPLQYHNTQLYQKDNHNIVRFDPELLKLVDVKDLDCLNIYKDYYAVMRDADGTVIIAGMRSDDDVHINHLEQINWIRES